MKDYFAEEILGGKPERDYFAEEIGAPTAVLPPLERFDPTMFAKAFASGMAEVPGETVKGARAYTPDIFDPFLVNFGNAISSLSSEELDREVENASIGVMWPTSRAKVGEALNTWQALVGRNMPIMMQSWLGRIVGAQVGGAIALGLGQLGPQAGTPEEIGTIPAMAIWGAHLGGYIPMVGVETENFLKEAENIGIDYDLAQKWARPYGLTSGVIEYSQQLLMMKPFMKIGKVAMIKLNNAVRKQVLRRFLGEAGVGLTEGAEEISQGALHTRLMKVAIKEMQDRSPGWQPKYDPNYRGLWREGAAGTGIAVITRGFGGGIARVTQRTPTEAEPKPAPLIEEINLPESEVVYPPAKFDVGRALKLTQGELENAVQSDQIGAHLRNEVEQAVGAQPNTLSDSQILETVKGAVDNDLVDIYTPEAGVEPEEEVTPEEKLKAMVEEAGGKWQGIQETPEMEDQIVFGDPATEHGSTMQIPVSQVTPEAIREKISSKAAEFGEEPAPVEGKPVAKPLEITEGISQLNDLATEKHQKDFTKITPKQRAKILQESSIPIVNKNEGAFLGLISPKDMISEWEPYDKKFITAKSGKYLSDGKYLIIDKEIADVERARYWKKQAKKVANVEEEKKEVNESEPVDYAKVIPEKKGEKVTFQGIVGDDFIYTTGKEQISLNNEYVKTLKKYFPNAELTMTGRKDPVQFWAGGKLKALLMPTVIDIPFGPTGEVVTKPGEARKAEITVEDIRENFPASLAKDTPLNKLTSNEINDIAERLGVEAGVIRDILRRSEEAKPTKPIEEPTEKKVPEEKAPEVKEAKPEKLTERIKTYYTAFFNAIDEDKLPTDPKGLRDLIEKATGEDPREHIDEMYDALEGAINAQLALHHSENPEAGLDDYVKTASDLEENLANRLRSLKIKKLQQFSTPLPLAEIMAYALDVQEGETVLEPTAGTGNLVAPLKGKAVFLQLIEIDPDRAEVLKQQGYKPLTQDFLKWEGKADSVIMNPPWGGLATRKYAAVPTPFKAGDISQRFVARALEIIPENGRVVALMPINTIRTSGTSFRQWLDKNHTVRAIIQSPANLYEKRGTAVESVLLVVDKGKLDVPRVGITKTTTLDELKEAVTDLSEWGEKARTILTKEEKPAIIKVGEISEKERKPGKVSEGKPEVPVSAPVTGVERPSERGVAPGEVERGAGEGLEPRRAERGPGEARREAPVLRPEAGPAVQPAYGERTPITGTRSIEARREAVISGGSYVEYTKLHRDPSSHPSPTDVVIVSHQASVKSPDLTYQPKTHVNKAWKLKDSEGNWLLTDPQQDNILLTRQAHLTGHAILNADQVGMGKTRQAGAVIMDELESGEVNRYLYITPNQALASDVISEFNILGGGKFPYRIVNLAAVKNLPKQTIPAYDKAVYILTLPKARRALELLRGIGFDGAVFDECHKFNTDEGKASKIAWDRLHEFIPHHHITYMSATPGKDLGELQYLYALGEWTKQTFANYIERITGTPMAAARRGFVSRSFLSRTATLPITEQVIRELKMKGKYASRELSMEGIPMEQVDASFDAEQIRSWDSHIDFLRKIFESCMRYAPLNKLRGGITKGLVKSQLQFAAKRRLVDEKLKRVVEEANKDIAQGKRVVIFTSYINEGSEERGHLVGAINTINDVSAQMVEGEAIIEEIPEAIREKVTLREEIKNYPLPLNIIQYIKDNIKGKTMAFVGSTTANQREKIAKQFREGQIQCIIGSDAAKTGVSFHDLASKQVIAYNIDPEFSVVTNAQMLGRVNRLGQKTKPMFKLVNSGAGGEQKFLITLAARMKNLGATSKGMAETASSKFLEDFALEGHLAHEAAREAWQSLPTEEKEWFTNGMLWETIPRTGQTTPKRSAPKDFMVDNYLYDLHLMPYGKSKEMYTRLIDEYKTQLEAASDLIAIVGMKRSGKYLREIPLAEDVTLHEVQDKEGKKLGVLTGMLTDKMRVFHKYNIDHYITFTAQDRVLSGLHVLPSKIPQIAKQFGKALAQTVTPDNAYDLIMAGDTVPLVGEMELYLRRNKDYIGVKNAKMKDQKALLASGAKYSPVGNAWLLDVSEQDVRKFIKGFPIRQIEVAPTEVAMAKEPSMQEENYADMAKKSAGKIPTNYKSHFEMPELVLLATEILGKPPIVRKLRASWGKFYYKEGQDVAGIKMNPLVFKDSRLAAIVLGHEIGHLFDWIPDATLRRGNIIGRVMVLNNFLKHTFEDLKSPELRSELIALSEYWRPYNRAEAEPWYIQARQSSRELYADAISVLLNNPDALKKYSPTFYETFFDNLDKKPLVKQKLMELENFLNLGDEAKYKNRQDRIRNMYKKGEEEFRKVREENGKRRASIGLMAYHGLIDRAAGVLAKERELKAKGIILNPDDNPRYYLEEYNYLAGKIRNLLINFDKKISLPMTEDGLTRDDLDDYLFLNRIIHERKEIANPKGFTPETASWQMAHLLESLGDKRAKALKGYAEKFYTMNKELLTEAFEVGLYDKERHGNLLNNPSYATFRVVDYIQEYVSPAILHQIGTLKDIASPSTATVMKNVAIIRAVERVKTTNSIINMMQQYFPGDIEEASYLGFGKFRRIKEKNGRGILKTVKDGQLKGYYVDPVIAWSMERNSTAANNVIIRILRTCNSNYFRPIYVTINLGFQSYNLMRDFLRSWLFNPDRTLVGHLKSYFKALPHAKSRLTNIPTELIQEMQEKGMLSATYNDVLRGQTETESQIDALMKQYDYIRGSEDRNFFKAILDGIADMGNLIETIPKVAGYMDRAGTQLHMKEIAHEVRVYAGSPDFLRKSGLYEYTNELFLFSNAMKEGMRGDFEGAVINPRTRAGYWWKRAMITFLPKLVMFLAVAGVFGRRKKEEFDKISEYHKAHYNCIPIGVTENDQVVYLRLPQDDQGRMMGALFWKALNWHKNGILQTLQELAGYTGGQLPSLAPIIEMVWVAGQYIGGSNPRDLFRGQPILSYDEYRAKGWYATKKIGKWFLRQSGLLGFGYYWEEDDTTLVKFIKAMPILQRYVKISKYGEEEILRKEREVIEKERAIIRLKRREAQK